MEEFQVPELLIVTNQKGASGRSVEGEFILEHGFVNNAPFWVNYPFAICRMSAESLPYDAEIFDDAGPWLWAVAEIPPSSRATNPFLKFRVDDACHWAGSLKPDVWFFRHNLPAESQIPPEGLYGDDHHNEPYNRCVDSVKVVYGSRSIAWSHQHYVCQPCGCVALGEGARFLQVAKNSCEAMGCCSVESSQTRTPWARKLAVGEEEYNLMVPLWHYWAWARTQIKQNCRPNPRAPLPQTCRGPCRRCGCALELDSFGDRICWCATCQQFGCQPDIPNMLLNCELDSLEDGGSVVVCRTLASEAIAKPEMAVGSIARDLRCRLAVMINMPYSKIVLFGPSGTVLIDEEPLDAALRRDLL